LEGETEKTSPYTWFPKSRKIKYCVGYREPDEQIHEKYWPFVTLSFTYRPLDTDTKLIDFAEKNQRCYPKPNIIRQKRLKITTVKHEGHLLETTREKRYRIIRGGLTNPKGYHSNPWD
jgi:hypothetical protein